MSELRSWAIAAYNQGMYDGQYVFIYVNQQSATEDIYDQINSVSFYVRGDGLDDQAQKAYQNFFMVWINWNSLSLTLYL